MRFRGATVVILSGGVALLGELNGVPEALATTAETVKDVANGAVRYAVVSTRADQYVTPVESQVPDGPADRVVSVLVEDVCPQVVQPTTSRSSGCPGWRTRCAPADSRTLAR